MWLRDHRLRARLSEMKPRIGQPAPPFRALAVSASGQEVVELDDYLGKKLVLVFYPKDNTPGCTIQACAIRDHWAEISTHAELLGISTDMAASHRKFADKRKIPYPLIADTKKQMVEQYGVWTKKSFFRKSFYSVERSTFVIAEDGLISHILEKVNPFSHSRQLLEILSK